MNLLHGKRRIDEPLISSRGFCWLHACPGAASALFVMAQNRMRATLEVCCNYAEPETIC